MAQTIRRRVGDTDLLLLTLSAVGLSSLINADTIRAYFKRTDEGTNHVDGVDCPVVSGLQVSLNPVGAKSGGGDAFQSKGTYVGRIVVQWNDGTVTTHPDTAKNDVRIAVTE